MDKFWIGGKSADEYNYDNDENWQPFSLRNSTLSWTASGSGTGEYYLRTSGGANPATGDLSGLVEPQAVYESGTPLTAGTAGSLTASQWDWADNDSLGYSTIYVRTSGSVDPDTLATNAITATDTPNANDNVYIGPNRSTGTDVSYDIRSGLDQASVELDDFIVLPTYTGKIGSATEYLTIDMADADVFQFSGRGRSYIDVGTAAIDPVIKQTATASTGISGLYLTGSAIDVLTIETGNVELTAATVTNAMVKSGGSLTVDYDTTATTVNTSGTVNFNGTGTTINVSGGVVTKTGTDAIAINITGGTVYNDGTGTVTVTIWKGVFESLRDARDKSVTLTRNGGDCRIGENVTLTGTFNAATRFVDA